MKMKTKYLVMMVLAVLMGTQVMNAQKGKEPGERKARKRMTAEQVVNMQSNRIIAELGLDDKTAAKFKEVYKKYMTEMNDLRKEYMPKKPEVKPGENTPPPMPTDAEEEKMMRNKFALGRKMLDVREKYYDEFLKFLSPKQVLKIYTQDEMNRGKFHKEMNRRAGMKHPANGPQKGAPKK